MRKNAYSKGVIDTIFLMELCDLDMKATIAENIVVELEPVGRGS